MYIQTAQLGDFNRRVSTFRDAKNADDGLEKIFDATKASLDQVHLVLQSLGDRKRTDRTNGMDEIPVPDWCSGVRELWLSQTDPCTELAKDLARLREEVTTWEGPQIFFAHLQQMAILCSSKYYSHRVADWHFGADRKLHHGKSRVFPEFLSWIRWFASACSGWSSQFGRAVSYFEPGGKDTSSRGACAAWHVGLVGHDPRLAWSATYHPFVLWWSIHLGISH